MALRINIFSHMIATWSYFKSSLHAYVCIGACGVLIEHSIELLVHGGGLLSDLIHAPIQEGPATRRDGDRNHEEAHDAAEQDHDAVRRLERHGAGWSVASFRLRSPWSALAPPAGIGCSPWLCRPLVRSTRMGMEKPTGPVTMLGLGWESIIYSRHIFPLSWSTCGVRIRTGRRIESGYDQPGPWISATPDSRKSYVGWTRLDPSTGRRLWVRPTHIIHIPRTRSPPSG